jgi:hypothetical protein
MGKLKNGDQLLHKARRGNGGAKLITSDQLLELYDHAAENGLILDGIEPFKIEERNDIPYVNLTVAASEIHETYAGLNWEQRIHKMRNIICNLLRETKRIGGEFRFNAWVSDKEDWIE